MILNSFLMILHRKPLSLCPFVAGLKKIALKSDFIYIFLALITLPICCRFKKNCFEVRFYIHFFHVSPHVYSPGQGQQSIGDKILMTTERPFLFAHMLQVSKWSLWNLILHIFLMILYMYIARGKGRKPLGDKILMSTESPYHFDHLLQVSNKSLWILILYTFFNVFQHVYSPGAGAENPLGSEFLYKHKPFVTLVICCKFLPLNEFLTVFPI